jgi:hypothetical protein
MEIGAAWIARNFHIYVGIERTPRFFLCLWELNYLERGSFHVFMEIAPLGAWEFFNFL